MQIGKQKIDIADSWGDEIGATMIDELMVSEKNRICGGVFNGTTPDTMNNYLIPHKDFGNKISIWN